MSLSVVSRRALLAGGGGLALGFALGGAARAVEPDRPLPGSLANNPELDAWMRIDADGAVTLLTGKVELGQGVLTALTQILADALDVAIEPIRVISGDTGQSPKEGPTAGSMSMPYAGAAVRQAGIETRALLLKLAASRAGAPLSALRTRDGAVLLPDGGRLPYGELLAGQALRRRATGLPQDVPPAESRHVGTATPRRDLPAKITGAPAFLHDDRPPGLVHARVLRPPSIGAQLVGFDPASVEVLAGVIMVVRDGSFLAVIAEKEHQAILAHEALRQAARWREISGGPNQDTIQAWLKARPSEEIRIVDRPTAASSVRIVEAAYSRPMLMHGAIGPSVAIGLFEAGRYVIHTHSQSVFETAAAIAQMLAVDPGSVRLIHRPGSGCYGHNGADDAAADAALLARALPGRPVRVQWSREDEHGCEPLGSAMHVELAAGVDARGDIVDWRCDLWSMAHSTRPGGQAGNLLPAPCLAQPFPAPPPRVIPAPNYGPDRNAIPLYDLPGQRVTTHFIRESPVRVSSLRSLGAFANVFAIESLMDELALGAGADPLAYRLRHLSHPRATELLLRTAEAFGWSAYRKAPGRGRGLAFARYKNLAAYCVVCLEVEVSTETGVVRVLRATAGVDSGAVVNPDGLRNQIEGGLIQALSWSLKEEVVFADGKVLSTSWGDYPILTFSEVPPIEVLVIDRPDTPLLGAGETAQGPTPAALANAVFDAIGVRMRHLPLKPQSVLEAIASAAG
ncbi:MAG: molybdopterin-dependent oxidoreductase [Caulobacter sp.]|nr:molybdopterin-dependent oxidoreductase [Caulobacter sp.]